MAFSSQKMSIDIASLNGNNAKIWLVKRNTKN